MLALYTAVRSTQGTSQKPAWEMFVSYFRSMERLLQLSSSCNVVEKESLRLRRILAGLNIFYFNFIISLLFHLPLILALKTIGMSIISLSRQLTWWKTLSALLETPRKSTRESTVCAVFHYGGQTIVRNVSTWGWTPNEAQLYVKFDLFLWYQKFLGIYSIS